MPEKDKKGYWHCKKGDGNFKAKCFLICETGENVNRKAMC